MISQYSGFVSGAKSVTMTLNIDGLDKLSEEGPKIHGGPEKTSGATAGTEGNEGPQKDAGDTGNADAEKTRLNDNEGAG